MYAQVATVAFVGIEARIVRVEVHLGSGSPHFAIVGLPDKALAESRDRIRAAMTAIGLGLPPRHITVNLAPADLPKEGSHYDVAIALGLMVAAGALPSDAVEGLLVIGELGLDGSIRSVLGALPAAVGAQAAGLGLVCPRECGPEAAWAGDDLDIVAPDHLLSLVNHLRGTQILSRPAAGTVEHRTSSVDFSDIKGQDSAKRVLEIAAAGGHNVLVVGPPGSGKTMLASRLPTILPPLSAAELLEVSMVHSLAGTLSSGTLMRNRPFRHPHHSASMAALVGGGLKARPGEASLAHRGVLFLDEVAEFSPNVLDALRQPLESGECVIARANHRIAYPARFQLVAAMNPCRCGQALEPGHSCARGSACVERYQSRLSGPLLDRIDLQIAVPAVKASDLVRPASGEPSVSVLERVVGARKRQEERYRAVNSAHRSKIVINAECSGALMEEVAALDPSARTLLSEAADRFAMTARGYHRVLKVSRTIADLDQKDAVARSHMAEALAYRGHGPKLGEARGSGPAHGNGRSPWPS